MVKSAQGAERPVGIREVARVAGVSVASASFALNGQSGVAPKTRLRILAAAEELGYRANPQAQALRRGRTTTYGFIVRNFSNPFFLDVMSGAEEVAGRAGASLLVLDSNYSLDRERQHVQEMAARHVEGLAIAPVGTGESIELWQSLRPGNPAVAINALVRTVTGVSRVHPDNRAAVELPMRRLAALGHQSVGFLAAPRSLMADPDRLRHFRRMARELDLRPEPIYSALTIPDVQKATRALLSGPHAPTAVMTNSDFTAHAIYKTAREIGVPVGPGLSVVGHDDLPTSELLDPPLATLRLDARQMGRELMTRLLDKSVTDDFVAPVEFVERASVQVPDTSNSGAVHRRLIG